ncbi:MAG: glutathione S-transferase [Marinosulfonomonas sp.]|nr:glutathione S-transferase [Marinosulfonomonas sp.]
MKLYKSDFSPFARKVMVVLHETGQMDDLEFADVSGTTIDAGTMPLAHNPLGKLPVLERDDGPAIYDSRVICRFLNARVNGNLYPDGNRLWDTLTLEATGDGIMESGVAMVYEARVRPPEMQYQAVVDGHWAKIDRSLSALNKIWISHLSGSFDMGQVSVASALGYLDLRHNARNWRKGNDALANWFEKISERASLKATAPPT